MTRVLAAVAAFATIGLAAEPALALDAIGKYKVLKEVVRTGGRVIYSATDPASGAMVFIKAAYENELSKQEYSEVSAAYLNELKVARRLAGVYGVLKVYDAAKSKGLAYAAIEAVAGQPAMSLLENGKHPGPAEAAGALAGALDVLDDVHKRGVIHRDFQPANIILEGRNRVKIADFGVALVGTPGKAVRTESSLIIGTPAYMSPEQVKGGLLDARTDVFSAGIVLYQLLTGRQPFAAPEPTQALVRVLKFNPPPPSTVDPNVPAAYDRVVEKALAKDPAARYQSAAAFGAALRQVIGEKAFQLKLK